VKAAVGERAAEAFVKEQEEEGDLNPFWGETVGVAVRWTPFVRQPEPLLKV